MARSNNNSNQKNDTSLGKTDLSKKTDEELLKIADDFGVDGADKILKDSGREGFIHALKQKVKHLFPGDDETEADDETPVQKLEKDFKKDTQFFKSIIPGLHITFGPRPRRNQLKLQKKAHFVRFIPYKGFNEEKGEEYTIGLLHTEEPDAIEVMQDDPNVTELTKDEYLDLAGNLQRTKF